MEIKQGLDDSPARLPTPAAEMPTLKTVAELRADLERSHRLRWREQVLGSCPADLVSFAAGASALVYHPFDAVRARLETEGARDLKAFDRRGTQAVAFCRQELWNAALRAVKFALVAVVVVGLAWVLWKAYRMSPELTIMALVFVAVNIITEFAAE